MSTFKSVDGVPGTTPVPPAGGARFGPFPSTKIRKLFTPGTRVTPLCATSANPSAAGIVPATWVDTAPVATPEQRSNAPEQSAKLITIDGVPFANALGAGNNPSVNCSKLTAPRTNDRDTAAYSTLQPPEARLTISPYSVDVPE